MPIAINPTTGEAAFLTPDGQWKPAQTAVNPQTNEKLVFDGQQWQPMPKAAPAADKYEQAAQAEFDKAKAAGVPVEAGYGRRVLQGMTLGGADEAMAALSTPIEMISHGTFNPVEGYKYAKAYEDAVMNDARKRQGALGTVAEIAGGLGTGGALGKAGVTLAREGAGLGERALRMAGEGAAYGGVQGLLDGGNSVEDRLGGAAKGVALGGAVGGALPVVATTAKTLAAPVISNIRARINPVGVGTAQVARALDEAGRPVADVVGDVQAAAAEGQPMYTVADALGFPGQRLLRTTVSANGPGRTDVVNFLEQRQAGQGRRLANALAEGFQSPQTAQQAEKAMTAARDSAADVAFGKARVNAAPVDVTPAIATIDKTLQPGVNQIANPQSGIANDSIESVLQRFRDRLTDGKSVLSDYTAVERVRGDIADAAQRAFKSGEGNKGRLLKQVVRAIDASMEDASTGFKAANRDFARRSKAIDAIDAGRTAALRGRIEDTVPAFRAMPADQQAAFRVGYVDPLIEQVQGPAIGANKARPFTSDAFKAESQAIAPLATGNQMARRLAREQRMFETRAEATGGSKTDMNLADQASQAVDPGLLADVATLNVHGIGRRVLANVTNGLNGYTPAVRQQIVKLLLERGANPGTEAQIAAELARIQRNRAIAAALLRGATIGTATRIPSMSR